MLVEWFKCSTVSKLLRLFRVEQNSYFIVEPKLCVLKNQASSKHCIPVKCVNTSKEPVVIAKGQMMGNLDEVETITTLPSTGDEYDQPGDTTEIEMKSLEVDIVRQVFANPDNLRLRRTPQGFADEEHAHLMEQVNAGILVESKSPWASTMVLVRRKEWFVMPVSYLMFVMPAFYTK